MHHLQRVVATLSAAVVLLLATHGAEAATNQASFNIAGSTPVLSNTITLNTTNLSLVKGAYLTSDGSSVDGATLPAGTLVDFLIYVDNTTAVGIGDANIADTLDTIAFAYQPGSIRVYNGTNTGLGAATILSDVKTSGTVMIDAVDGVDVAGISGAVISAGSSAGNATLNLAASKVWALVFTVRLL